MTMQRLKRIIQISSMLILIFTSMASFSQSQVKRYNLAGFRKAVLGNNLQLKIAENAKKTTDLSTKEARSQLLPQANGQAELRRFFNDQLAFFEFPDFENIDPVTGEIPVETQSFKIGFDNNFQADVLVEQSLFNVKQVYDLKAAQEQVQLGHFQYQDMQRKILAEAEKSFLQAVLMKQVLAVNRQSEQNAKVNYEDAQNKLANGLISELDMLQAKIGYEEEIPNTLQAARNYYILLGSLKILAGLSPEDSLVIEHDIAAFEPFHSSNDAIQGIKNRPDYQMLERNIQLQEWLVKGTKADFLPTLSIGLGYSYATTSDEWNFSDNRNEFLYASFSVRMPIYSGGYRTVQLQKAKIAQETAILQQKDAFLAMNTEAQNLRLKLTETYQTVLTTQSTLASAKKAFQIAQRTLKDGLISQLDFRRIKNDYKQAEVNHYFSIYNYKSTIVDFNQATGN